MPVHVGIACPHCQRVYFLANDTSRIEPDHSPANLNMFRLTCPPPCSAVRLFHDRDMRPYSVSTYSFERGYANCGEYRELGRTA
jgi:hypothetical protein